MHMLRVAAVVVVLLVSVGLFGYAAVLHAAFPFQSDLQRSRPISPSHRAAWQQVQAQMSLINSTNNRRNAGVASCNLCSNEWVFILSTGRAGSTSTLESLNAIPGVHLSGENQASLQAAADLFGRHEEVKRRASTIGTASELAAIADGNADEHELLCIMQNWFRDLVGGDPGDYVLGFKELVTLPSQATVHDGGKDHHRHRPPARHLAIGSDGTPGWLTFLDRLFPCARIVFNTRDDTAAQAKSAFHKTQGTTLQDLNVLNAAVKQLHKRRGVAASFHITKEQLSPTAYTQLAKWLGLDCQFAEIPWSNDGAGANDTAGLSSYISDKESIDVKCGGAGTTQSGMQVGMQGDAASMLKLASRVTFGIKHVSNNPQRREQLTSLLASIRKHYPMPTAIVAYYGLHRYPEQTVHRTLYLAVGSLEAGVARLANAIVAKARTPFVLFMNDDVQFGSATRVDLLVGHLVRDHTLTMVSGCVVMINHHMRCAGSQFSFTGQTMRQEPAVQVGGAKALTRGRSIDPMALELFLARVDFLVRQPWDEGKEQMEDEILLASLVFSGIGGRVRTGCDMRVTVDQAAGAHSTAQAIASMRRKNSIHLQYLCHTFPRVTKWTLSNFDVDCRKRTFSFLDPHSGSSSGSQPLLWDTNDSSSIVYVPPPTGCFIVIATAANLFKERDNLRRGWLGTWNGSVESLRSWDYGFFVGGVANGSSTLHAGGHNRDGVMYGDIVKLPHIMDDYMHLAEKILAALHWTAKHIAADFVLKLDGDTWAVPDLVSQWLQRYGDAKRKWYGGIVRGRSPVLREGKWAVSTEKLNATEYPEYAVGGAYVFSMPAVPSMLEMIDSGTVPFIPNVEDAMVGLAALAMELTPVKIPGWIELTPVAWTQEVKALLDWECCGDGVVIYHKPPRMDLCDHCVAVRRLQQAPILPASGTPCESWCGPHPDRWTTKCLFKACRACVECTVLGVQS